MGVVVLITVIAGGIAGFILVAKRAAARRSESLRQLAARLGWGFHEDVPFKSIPDLDRFELFKSGHSKKLQNLLTSPGTDARIVVFDYQYTTGGGNSQSIHRQTVFYTTHDGLRLPSFSLRPENFFHRVAAAFGYSDINYEHRPVFSRSFLLRGDDEARIRGAYNDDVLAFFEERIGCCAAGVGRELLFWRPAGFAPPEEIEALIAEGRELTARFLGLPRRM